MLHCLNLSASAAVKVSAIQNAENVARKVVKMLKTSAKKTALLKSCVKEDASSIGSGSGGGRGGGLAPPLFFRGGPGGALIYEFISTILPLHECI